jgi:hypothetical protein
MKYYFKCPNCESDDQFTQPVEERSGLWASLLVFGGLLPTIFYAAEASRRRVQCAQCGYIFKQPPFPKTSLSHLAIAVIGIVLVSALLTTLMILWPEIMSIAPQHPFLSSLEKAIANNPKSIVLGVFPMMLLLIVVALFASWISNVKANKKLRQKFATKPLRFSESKKETSTKSSTTP